MNQDIITRVRTIQKEHESLESLARKLEESINEIRTRLTQIEKKQDFLIKKAGLIYAGD